LVASFGPCDGATGVLVVDQVTRKNCLPVVDIRINANLYTERFVGNAISLAALPSLAEDKIMAMAKRNIKGQKNIRVSSQSPA